MGRKNPAFTETFPFLAGAVLLLGLLVFLEVVFQASKVSQFSKLGIYQQIAVPFISLLFLCIPVIGIWLVTYICSRLLHQHEKVLRLIRCGYLFVLCFMFLAILFAHLDTLVYTVFQENVYSLPHIATVAILILLMDLAALLTVKRGRRISDFMLTYRGKLLVVILALWGISLFFSAHRLYGTWKEASALDTALAASGSVENRPNIILISADSLDSRRLGAYGYIRETTPHISGLQNTVRYTRAYTNCGNSRGSIMSVLTGKSPVTTRLIFPPDILHGNDAFQHLPNILARLGYYNVDLNDGFYTSTSRCNLRDGFHAENGHKTDFATGLGFRKRLRIAFSDETYFLRNLFETYKHKIRYIITGSPPPFDYAKFLIVGEGSDWNDEKRVETLRKLVDEIRQPLFAHIHLLSTHGPFFAPPVRKFSIKGADAGSLTEETVLAEQRRRYYSQENTLPEFAVQFDHYEVPPEKRAAHWNTYDDAILSVDHYFGKIMNMLRETGRLENSLIVFFTDHGMGYFTTDVDKVRFPLPLIVRLPDRQGQTVLDKPVQYLDIAPSILAYLDQPIPEWMEGHVIFKKSMDAFDLPNRALVTAGFLTENAQPAGRLGFHYAVKAANVGPPYFGMDLFGVATQDHYYLYSTELGSGGLYDVSANPYDFREISDRALEDDYYNRLYQYLAERGIHLREEPA